MREVAKGNLQRELGHLTQGCRTRHGDVGCIESCFDVGGGYSSEVAYVEWGVHHS